jgi:hypothetical protein
MHSHMMNQIPTNAPKNQCISTLIHSYMFWRFRDAIFRVQYKPAELLPSVVKWGGMRAFVGLLFVIKNVHWSVYRASSKFYHGRVKWKIRIMMNVCSKMEHVNWVTLRKPWSSPALHVDCVKIWTPHILYVASTAGNLLLHTLCSCLFITTIMQAAKKVLYLLRYWQCCCFLRCSLNILTYCYLPGGPPNALSKELPALFLYDESCLERTWSVTSVQGRSSDFVELNPHACTIFMMCWLIKYRDSFTPFSHTHTHTRGLKVAYINII